MGNLCSQPVPRFTQATSHSVSPSYQQVGSQQGRQPLWLRVADSGCAALPIGHCGGFSLWKQCLCDQAACGSILEGQREGLVGCGSSVLITQLPPRCANLPWGLRPHTVRARGPRQSISALRMEVEMSLCLSSLCLPFLPFLRNDNQCH